MAAGKDGFGGAFVMTIVGCERPAKPFLYERPQQKHTLCWPHDLGLRHMGFLSRVFDSRKRRSYLLARAIVGSSHQSRLQFISLHKGPSFPEADSELFFAFCLVGTHWVDRYARSISPSEARLFVAQVWSDVVELLVAHAASGGAGKAFGEIVSTGLHDAFEKSQSVFWRVEPQLEKKLVEGSLQWAMGQRLASCTSSHPAEESVRLGAILAVELANELKLMQSVRF